MAYIEIKHLTKDYGKKRGIFDMSLEVEKGEIYGFVGVNGAGKTTTIRHMMGFLTPDEGTVTINGLDANKSSAAVKRYVSYIPGEINFPGNSTGEDFIKNQIYLSGRGDWEYAENVIDQLQLDAKANVRAMSKGMKQKTAIVSAFASDADILIMDEPTTGLDPLMRDIFIELLKEEKAKGKTIFMSSHIFQEVEEVCDRVAIIRDGMIIDVIDMKDIRYNKMKTYKMEFKSIEDFEHFRSLGYDLHRVKVDDLQLNIMIHDQDINRLIQDLKNFNLVYFKEIKVTFEDYVTQVFKGKNNMFSKPIFKQSIQANWKLWVIITFVAAMILSAFTVTFDAEGFAAIASAAEGTRFSNILSTMTSLLGSLENFYKLIAVILGIVYVVFTANNLVVNEVDSGSMAYTLSTPIKRSSVIFTKSIFLVLSIVLMYGIIGSTGLVAAQLKYQNVTGYTITDDVRAAAEALNQDEGYISERMYLILENDHAMREAAAVRNMDTEAYTIYLESVINDRSYEEAAAVITDERWDIYKDDEDMEDEDIEITAEELAAGPTMLLLSNDALVTGAKVTGLSVNEYQQFINNEIVSLEQETEVAVKEEKTPNEEGTEATVQPTVMVSEDNADILMQLVIESSAKALNMETDQVADKIAFIKDPVALEAAMAATDLTEQQIITMANNGMVSSAKAVDEALEFDTEAYIWLSVGLLLLILALSSISFFASTLFNRTGLALAIGGGIPFTFFIITMVQQLMDTSENLEYLTITTLFDTEAILTGGDFGWGLVALGGITFVLYAASNVIFTKKDLPL